MSSYTISQDPVTKTIYFSSKHGPTYDNVPPNEIESILKTLIESEPRTGAFDKKADEYPALLDYIDFIVAVDYPDMKIMKQYDRFSSLEPLSDIPKWVDQVRAICFSVKTGFKANARAEGEVFKEEEVAHAGYKQGEGDIKHDDAGLDITEEEAERVS